MLVEYSKDNRELLISFIGEIDHHTCDGIRTKADYEIQKYSPKKVIFDFKNVNFMDSSGIGMLIGRYKQIIRLGGSAEITNVSKDIRRIFEMSGIFKIMPLKEEIKI